MVGKTTFLFALLVFRYNIAICTEPVNTDFLLVQKRRFNLKLIKIYIYKAIAQLLLITISRLTIDLSEMIICDTFRNI